MALVKFDPDPELFDPDDPEGWYGTWHHDDGSSVYGQGSAELGEPLLAPADDRLAALSPEEQQAQDDERAREWLAEGGQQLAPVEAADAPAQPRAPAPVAQPAPRPAEAPMPAATGEATPTRAAPATRADWDGDVPPEVSSALREQAAAAGLSPDALAAVIKHESGWNPAIVNKKTGKHGGLIQFDRDGWAGVAKAAGRPDVTWEQMTQMSAAEQVPFVIAYYQGKGLTPESTVADYAMRTFMPAHANESDDFVLGEKGSQGHLPGGLNLGKVYEQNAGLDLNRDGRILKGEVGQAYGGAPGGAGAAPPGPAQPQLGAGLPGVPPSYGGMPLASVKMQGAPRAPGDVQAEAARVASRYGALAGAHQEAERLRGEGQAEAFAYIQQQTAAEKADALAETERQAKIATDAQARIDRDVNAPIQQVDPKRLFKEMSAGQKIMGAIAVLFSALGQAANATIGINTPNLALGILDGAIEKDLDAQRDAIARGERQANNRIAHWSRVLGNAESARDAARGEAKVAAGKLLQLQASFDTQNTERQAAALEYSAQLFAQGQAEIDKVLQRETERMQVEYARPTAKEQTPQDFNKNLEASKLAFQELLNSGVPPEQAARILEANGVPVVPGETVTQKTAREGVEAKAEEETSKELQPVSEAEAMWKKALAQLDALEDHALTTRRYKPGGVVAEYVTSTLPGWPSQDEQSAFEQAITAATNAQIAALGRASDSDEARIKSETIGRGDLQSYRRGIENQLAKLTERRRMLSARREGAASRVGQREASEGPRPADPSRVPDPRKRRTGASGSY
jgi:hypothetical protein